MALYLVQFQTLLSIGGVHVHESLATFFNKETYSWEVVRKGFPQIPCQFYPGLLFPQLQHHSAVVVDGDIYVAGGKSLSSNGTFKPPSFSIGRH